MQSQRNNLGTEFARLAKDLPGSLALVRDTLTPAARNLWMGNAAAVSSLHFDFYENILGVLQGHKHVTLLPPSDLPFVYFNDFPEAHWLPIPGAEQAPFFELGLSPAASAPEEQPDTAAHGQPAAAEHEAAVRTPWVGADPALLHEEPDAAARAAVLERVPLLALTQPVLVTVRAGEALFIPATYLHKVTHEGNSGAVVAVNWWYDVHNPAVENYFSFMAHADRLFRHVTQLSVEPNPEAWSDHSDGADGQSAGTAPAAEQSADSARG